MKYVKYFLVALLAICVGLFVYWQREQLQQVKDFQSSKETVSKLQDSIQALKNDVASLQDSVKNILAKNPDIDVQMRLNHLEKDIDRNQSTFNQTVNDYNDKISHQIDLFAIIISIFIGIVTLITAILAIGIPYLTNKSLEKKIDEVRLQAQSVQADKEKVESIKEDVEKNANEANASNFYKIGLSKFEEGKPGEALENIERAISLKKDYPEAIFLLGLLKYETKGVDEALTDINDAIAKSPYYADAIYIKSLLEFEKGNADEAVGDINYAKKLKKDVIESYPYRTHLTGRMKALDNAIHYCDYSADMKTLIGLIKTEKSKEYNPNYLCNRLNSISIEIPASVTVIGDRAFYKCTNLTSIKIPDSVTVIGDSAFYKCANLTSIKIPHSVTVIGDRALASCTRIKKYEVSKNNPNYCSIDGALYSKNKAKLIQVPCDRDSFKIPDNVPIIGNYAFYDCTNLTSIEIPDSVTEIRKSAFEGCLTLTSIKIPDSVTEIENNAFWDCISLSSIEIPDSVTEIGERAFYHCTDLTSIVIPGSVTVIGNGAFINCISLTSIEISDSVTKIGKWAFNGCTSLIKIHLKHTSPVDFSEAFRDLDLSKITLYVPKGSIKAYKKDPFYGQFKEIKEE